MKIIGIIPSRYESSRFPGKPLIDIHGKSMIQRVYEQCQKSELDEIWVATDDERIMNEVHSFNGRVVMTSKEIGNGSERCRAAFKAINSQAEAFINIQGDEPCISPLSINALINLLQKDHVQIATLIREEQDQEKIQDPNRVKVVKDKNNKALWFSRSVIPHARSASDDLKYFIHLGIYGFKSTMIGQLERLESSPEEISEQLEQLTWLVNDFEIHLDLAHDHGPSIDTPDDYKRLLSDWKQFAID